LAGVVHLVRRQHRRRIAGRHAEPRRVPMRRWFENRLAMLLAATYLAARARAMTALPHDELT